MNTEQKRIYLSMFFQKEASCSPNKHLKNSSEEHSLFSFVCLVVRIDEHARTSHLPISDT